LKIYLLYYNKNFIKNLKNLKKWKNKYLNISLFINYYIIMSKKVDNKKEIKETAEEKPKKPTNENFNKYSEKQHELIDFMKNNGFNVTVFGAPQSYISKVSKRDTDPAHTSAYDKLSFVEDFFKNHIEEAKKEYAEEEKVVEENKKNKPRTPKEHRCNCQFCTHKTLKKPHKCNCKYCTISKNDEIAEATEEAGETEPEKAKAPAKAKAAAKPKAPAKAPAKAKTPAKAVKAPAKPKAAKGGKKAKAEETVEEVVEEADS